MLVMKTIRSGTLLVLLLLPVLCGCRDTPELPRLPADATILAFGDSLTSGTGAGEGESYPARLQELTGRRVVNAGVPGEVTAAGLKRLPGLLDALRPDLLILCHGGNDFLRRLDREQTRANIGAMVELSRRRRIPVVLVSVPLPGLLLDAAPLYRDIAGQFGLPLEDEVIGDILSDRSLKSDAIHPNAAGYRVLAESLSGLLARAGAI